MTWHDMRWHDPQLRMAELNKQSLRLDSARRTHYKVIFRCSRLVTRCAGAAAAPVSWRSACSAPCHLTGMRCSSETAGVVKMAMHRACIAAAAATGRPEAPEGECDEVGQRVCTRCERGREPGAGR